MAELSERLDLDDPAVRAAHYRNRAIEIFAIVEMLGESSQRTILLMTAQDYLRMAEMIERQARSSARPAGDVPGDDCRKD